MIDDDRGRVPFAILGVILLASSVGLVATVDDRAVGTSSPDAAIEGATAESATALRASVTNAAIDAANAPVTTPANTTAGSALSPKRPFRDALELRVYLHAVERLDRIDVRRDGVTATVSLPPIEPTTDGYREAIDRVHVERVGDDRAALQVTIENVTVTATRNDRRVGQIERDPTFVVASPVLLLHDRTSEFESRANADLSSSGLSRRLTTRLYPIAWSRGIAQYGGAPIANVVGTRHVELATNDALLAEQRAVLGASDPGGDRGVAAAGRRVATTDLLAGVGGDEDWTDLVLSTADEIGPDPPDRSPVGTWRDPPSSQDISIEVGSSADRAFVKVIEEDDTDEIGRLLERSHTVETKVVTETSRLFRRTEGGGSPGYGWRRDGSSTSTKTDVSSSFGRPPRVDGAWTVRDFRVYTVTKTRTTKRTWRKENRTRTTERTVVRRHLVRIGVVARTPPITDVPSGTLDGPLSDATECATARSLDAAGGWRTIARDAITGSAAMSKRRVVADPRSDRKTGIRELRDVREHTEDVSTEVPAAAIGVGRVDPGATLRSKLSTRRESLLRYDGRTPQDRFRRGVRVAYLDALEGDLEERSEAHGRTTSVVDSAVKSYLDPARLDGVLAAHRRASRPEPTSVADPAGNLTINVKSAPPYLPTEPVDRERIDVRGQGDVLALATRNVNVFSSPHEQVAESIIDRIPWLGADRVSLATAAATLRAAERSNSSVDGRSRLRNEVRNGDAHVRGAIVDTLIAEGFRRSSAEQAVQSESKTAHRALAVTNGTATERILDRVAADSNADKRDRVRIQIELAIENALTDVEARPSRSSTSRTADSVRETARNELESVLADELEDGSKEARKGVFGAQLGSLPAGLPVTPVPGYWFATANVWYVETAGYYERLALRANRGDGVGSITYVRDGGQARISHEGDRRRLGTAERVTFRASTVIVVVVPPGGTGVGDTNGVVDERSPGWPLEIPADDEAHPSRSMPNGS